MLGSSSCGKLLRKESITDIGNSFEVVLAIAELAEMLLLPWVIYARLKMIFLLY